MLMGENVNTGISAFLQRFLNNEFEQATINISLAIVIGAIALSIVLSMLMPGKTETGKPDDTPGG
jgi:uncharacterized membrane protein (DUF485 family)